jgi:hypothetical protein
LRGCTLTTLCNIGETVERNTREVKLAQKNNGQDGEYKRAILLKKTAAADRRHGRE